jgi:hypothetical protein
VEYERLGRHIYIFSRNAISWTVEQASDSIQLAVHRISDTSTRASFCACYIKAQGGLQNDERRARPTACVGYQIYLDFDTKASTVTIKFGNGWPIHNYENTKRHSCLGGPASQTSLV